MKRLWTFAAIAALVIGALWAAKCYVERDALARDDREQRRDSLTTRVTVTDSVFVRDTLRWTETLVRYDTLRRRRIDTLFQQITLTDTVRVRRTLEEMAGVIAAGDTAIQACRAVVSSCTETIRARDALIRELSTPLQPPRLRYAATLLFDPILQGAVVRIGPEFRLVWGLSLVGEAEARQDGDGLRGALRVGLRKVF